MTADIKQQTTARQTLRGRLDQVRARYDSEVASAAMSLRRTPAYARQEVSEMEGLFNDLNGLKLS